MLSIEVFVDKPERHTRSGQLIPMMGYSAGNSKDISAPMRMANDYALFLMSKGEAVYMAISFNATAPCPSYQAYLPNIPQVYAKTESLF